MNHKPLLGAIPWAAALFIAVACSTSPGGTFGSGSSNGGSGSGATTGSAGSGSASGGIGSGASSGVGGTGATSGSGTGAASGGVGGTGATSGAGGTGATSGAGGTGASTGASSGASSSGAVTGSSRHGKSAGCGMAPVGAVSTGFTNHKLPIPPCAGCSAGPPTGPNCPRDCIAPEFAPGGVSAQQAGGESFTNRDFSIRLPVNYQPTTPYAVYLAGGGCGGGPPQTGDGYGIGATDAIQIGLGYLVRCFADGGSACAGSIKNEFLCKNGPEIPYVRFVLNWVESNFCVELGKEFIGGGSSGGWEAMTVSCGDADQIRGFVSTSGGLRVNQWACVGPMAGLMVTNSGDLANPVGPLATINADLDSFGAAPERDALLMRNGCVGTATTMYDAAFPACVKYTGCPTAFPVVWCLLNGGHDNTQMGGIDYKKAMWPFLSSLPPKP